MPVGRNVLGKYLGGRWSRWGGQGGQRQGSQELQKPRLRGERTSECKRVCWCGGEKTGGEERGYGCAWRWEQNVVINVVFDREPAKPRKDGGRVKWLMEGSQVMIWLAEFWSAPTWRIAEVQAGHKKQRQVFGRKVRVGRSADSFKVICFNWVTKLKTELNLFKEVSTFFFF